MPHNQFMLKTAKEYLSQLTISIRTNRGKQRTKKDTWIRRQMGEVGKKPVVKDLGVIEKKPERV